MKKSLSFFVAFAAVTALALPASAQTVVEDIVARINDQIITRSDLQRSREQLQTEAKQPAPEGERKPAPKDEKDLLRDLIDQQLLVQRGKDMGISADNDVVKRLDEIRKSMNLESMEDLEKAAQAQGISFEDFKSNMKNSIITQRVIGEEVGRKIQIPPAEAAAYYEKHKHELERPEQVYIAEILVSTEAPKPAAADPSKPAAEAPKPAAAADPSKPAAETPKPAAAADPSKPAAEAPKAAEPAPATPVDEVARATAAEAKAKELLESIRKGAKFEEVAKKSSDGPTAPQGGELGAFKKGSLAPELEKTLFAMKTGDVSDVIRTKQGFIILKVIEHQTAGVPPQKEVEPQINEALYYEKLQPSLRAYLTKLREDAYIDIKPGFIDTGASPNQTKPVVVASAGSAEEQQKKKKKKKMLLF